MDRVKFVGPTLLATIALLGEQGARVGSFAVPRISFSWIVVVLAAMFLFSAKRDDRRLGLRNVGAAALFGIGFVALLLWRGAALTPPMSLVVTMDGQQELVAQTLQLEARRDLRRLTGQRRNVTLSARARIEVPRDGAYEFELVCDDSCGMSIGGTRVHDSQSVALERGEASFALDYRQLAGPAALGFAWNTPALIEWLPIEYYLRSAGGADRRGQRLRAHASLALGVLWWGLFSVWVSRIAPFRIQIYERRWIPVGAAALITLYGCLLRFDAFLVHSSNDAQSSLQHWVPSYGVFHPASAPDDPYRADVRSYLERAETFTLSSFYAPSFREPFYIALCMPFLALAGGEIGILLQSLFFSCAALVLFGWLAARLHGRWWATLLLVPIALHEWLILEAPSGYRMSAYSFFLLATAAAMFVMPASRRGALVSGILAGLLCLIRLSAVSVVAPLLILRVWSLSPKERLRYGGLVLAALVVLVGPFLASNALTHQDPFYSISFHTEFWMRAEGIDVSANEGPVSWTRYFTDFDRAGTVLKGTLLGMSTLPIKTFWNGLRLFPVVDAAVLLLGVAGLIASLRSERRFIAAAYLAQLVPFAYIQNFPSGQMPRFVMPSYFFLVLAVPIAADWVSRMRSNRKALN